MKHFSALLLRSGVELLMERCHPLTLGLIPSTPSGTLGKASYSVETYVMTDFSSGEWTSTSDEGSKKPKRSQMQHETMNELCWEEFLLKPKSPSFTPHDLQHKKGFECFVSQSKHDNVYASHPRGPAVLPPPDVQLHQTRALNLTGWPASTHGSCRPGLACNRDKEKPVRRVKPGTPTKRKKIIRMQFLRCYCTCIYEWWR